MNERLRIHATAVALDGHAVLLRGASGAGKSDLALRLIDAGASLVADDVSDLQRGGAGIIVRGAPGIAGMIEVRGLGIMRVGALAEAPVVLIADLVSPQAVERLPEWRREMMLGLAVPVIALAPFEASAVAKLRLAVRTFTALGLPAMLRE
ncbi:MAG TPA: HPr kinase/phosphatase C-terminal domain-containing protein [Stellaceae bacterium]|nr:HPr kinase/phosphatase C-terminal domain-containing protein [Stellaceae bacterium]